jgi:hypothetical protein
VAIEEEKEIISCLLMVGVVLFVLVNYQSVARIPRSGMLLSALLCMLLFNLFTVCEILWPEAFYLLNLLEHICYVTYLIILALWCRAVFCRGGSSDD